MLEIVGQTLNTKGKTFIDVVPAIQCIYNSQWRFDPSISLSNSKHNGKIRSKWSLSEFVLYVFNVI